MRFYMAAFLIESDFFCRRRCCSLCRLSEFIYNVRLSQSEHRKQRKKNCTEKEEAENEKDKIKNT